MKILIFLLVVALAAGCVSDQNDISQDNSTVITDNTDTHENTQNNEQTITERPHDRFISFPECAGQKFTTPPVALDDLDGITPLGNLNPPDHTIPTQHVYFDVSKRTNVFAPGDITITEVRTTKDPVRETEDFGVNFVLCDEVQGYFLHIKKLSPELDVIAGNAECETHEGGYEYCRANVNKPVAAGTLIGEVGGPTQSNFDFGLRDFGTQLNFANILRYSDESRRVVCPLDYYEEAAKNDLYAKLYRTDGSCGEVMQDITGTLKGNWFFGDTNAESPGSWNSHLAFVHDNKNPLKSVISIGGIFTNPERWIFDPLDAGSMNREFTGVTPDGNIYCYEGEDPNMQGKTKPDGRIIVRMKSDTQLEIEQQNGSCTGTYFFTNPATYSR